MNESMTPENPSAISIRPICCSAPGIPIPNPTPDVEKRMPPKIMKVTITNRTLRLRLHMPIDMIPNKIPAKIAKGITFVYANIRFGISCIKSMTTTVSLICSVCPAQSSLLVPE